MARKKMIPIIRIKETKITLRVHVTLQNQIVRANNPAMEANSPSRMRASQTNSEKPNMIIRLFTIQAKTRKKANIRRRYRTASRKRIFSWFSRRSIAWYTRSAWRYDASTGSALSEIFICFCWDSEVFSWGIVSIGLEVVLPRISETPTPSEEVCWGSAEEIVFWRSGAIFSFTFSAGMADSFGGTEESAVGFEEDDNHCADCTFSVTFGKEVSVFTSVDSFFSGSFVERWELVTGGVCSFFISFPSSVPKIFSDVFAVWIGSQEGAWDGCCGGWLHEEASEKSGENPLSCGIACVRGKNIYDKTVL